MGLALGFQRLRGIGARKVRGWFWRGVPDSGFDDSGSAERPRMW